MWFKQIQSQIKSLPDSDRKTDLERSLVSVYQRVQYYFPYHRREVDRLLADGLEKVPTEHRQDAYLLMLANEEAVLPLRINCVLASAHVLAAAQSMHSAVDIHCRIVYGALDLSKCTKLNIESLSLHAMAKETSGPVGDQLKTLRDSYEFNYLADLVNTTKHRELITAKPTIGCDPFQTGLSIEAFTYSRFGSTRNHERKWVDDFLNIDCEVIVTMLNQIGEATAAEVVAFASAKSSSAQNQG